MLSPDRWCHVQPYLDQALAMQGVERTAWLISLRTDDPSLVDDLQALLHEHDLVEREGFLEGESVPLPPPPVLQGQTFGAYTLVSPIADGGMGSVWRAERADGRFTRTAAIKLLHVALMQRGAERFSREARILARLTHPHIAHLVDAGVAAAGQPYLVLEHVDGTSIDAYCDGRGLPVNARIRLFLDVLEAVAHAHANLVVHRDIKPSNVFVTADGQVKLLDFGIAKLLESESGSGAATRLTREVGSGLTPEYAAPEQVSGGDVSTATDIYSLGVLLFVLLTGQHPAGPGPHAPATLMKAIVETEPPRLGDVVVAGEVGRDVLLANASRRGTTPEKLRQALRGDLETVVAKTLKKRPDERYASVTGLADDLTRYLADEPVGARRDTLAYRAAKFARRNRAVVALAVLAALAAAGGFTATLLQARTARAERDFAVHQLLRAEATNDLNSFLLSEAAPSGKPFTVNDLLARAEHIVTRQRVEQESRTELLIAIGRQYWGQDEDAAARRVLLEAYRVSRGLADPSTRARASCALASVLARGPESARGEELFEAGLRELPDAPRFVRDRVFCMQCGSAVARERGAARDAVDRARAAVQLLDGSAFHSQLLQLRLLMDLAESYRTAGRQREAASVFERVSADLAAAGRDDTQTAGTLFNNWALALNQLGQPLQSERIYRQAIELSRADATERAVSPMLLTNYSRVLLDLGRTRDAAAYAERGYAMASQAGDQVVINQSLLLRAAIYREENDLARSAAMLDEVEPRLRHALPPGHIAFASLVSLRSLLARARGSLEASLDLGSRAVAMAEAAVRDRGQGADLLPLLLVRRSDVQLELGRAREAEDDAARALRLLQAATDAATLSSNVGRASMARGRALLALGKRQAARASLQAAVMHLEHALGPQHPETIAAVRLADSAK